MRNLLDNAEKINGNVLSKQIAEMEVYRISQYLYMILYDLYIYVLRFLGVFIKECKEKADSMEMLTFGSLLNCTIKNVYESKVYTHELQKNIQYHIRNSLYCLLSSKADGDVVSAKITKSASKILSRKELVGKSVYEVNDAVYRRYADKKKFHYETFLRLWLCATLTIIMVGGMIMILKWFPVKYVLTTLTIAEIIIYLFAARWLSIWHMARLVWLIRAESGTADTKMYEYPMSTLSKEEAHLVILRMRTLHTLMNSKEILLHEIEGLENEITSCMKKIEKNKETIQAIVNERTEENCRIIGSKQDENEHLNHRIADNRNKCNVKKKEIKNVEALISELKKCLISILSEKWRDAYQHLTVSNAAMEAVVCRFAADDIANMEKRFFEIDNTSNPQAIAQKKNDGYSIKFLTIRGGVANIVFQVDKKSGSITVQDILCADKLKETFVTNDELREAINGITTGQIQQEEYRQRMAELQNWYSTESQKWESQRAQLEKLNIHLTKEKEQLTNEISSKQIRIEELSVEITDRTKECNQLKISIDALKKEGNRELVAEKQKQLEKLHQQLNSLQCEYNEKLCEIEKLYAQIHTLNEKQSELCKALEQKEKKLEETKKQINQCNDMIKQKEKDIRSLAEKIQDKDNNIVTLNGLLKQADASKRADKDTIQKLRNAKYKLEKEKTQLNKEIENQKVDIDNLNIVKENTERLVAMQKQDISKLLQRLEDNYSKILYDEEIYNELYAWIPAAQKYVYIISPFISKYQFPTMRRKLKDAVRNNPNLRIKILYGMKDTNENGEIQKPENIISARDFIGQLQEALGSALTVKETNTHDKVILVDDKMFMLGSANVMSFTGDYARKKDLHNEIVISSRNKEQLMELKQKFFDW